MPSRATICSAACRTCWRAATSCATWIRRSRSPRWCRRSPPPTPDIGAVRRRGVGRRRPHRALRPGDRHRAGAGPAGARIRPRPGYELGPPGGPGRSADISSSAARRRPAATSPAGRRSTPSCGRSAIRSPRSTKSGSFVVTKHPGTGGMVTVDTVSSSSSTRSAIRRAYVTPDVHRRLHLDPPDAGGADRVRVSGSLPAEDTVP